MALTAEKSGIANQIKIKIGNRILLGLFLFFIIIIGLTIFDIGKSFKELGEVINAQCQSLEDFTVGQALINNQQAVQLKLNDYNANNPYKINWIPTGDAPDDNSIQWRFPLSWEYNYQIKPVAGQSFGYFQVTGSVLTDKDLLSELIGRTILMVFFTIVMLMLFYPLANKIPQQLFIEPINNLLLLLKIGAMKSSKANSKELTAALPLELVEIQNKITELLHEISEKNKLAALGGLASQVAHDIKSPTASLLILAKTCQDLPEKERIALREAAITIQDIANNLLNQYKQKDLDKPIAVEERQPILVSASMLQLMAEKKLQYQQLQVEFDYKFSQSGSFAFIKIEPTAFKRMLSNIINNAVDAFDKKAGKVILNLESDNEWVRVIIEDNGKGMPQTLVKKIMSNVAVTEGKQDGHGIGLTQVRETLQRNQGEFAIESIVGKGTKVILTFPRLSAPSWVAKEIKLGLQDSIIILDDDSSIHLAWDKRFELILNQAPSIKIQHFRQGQEALNYINKLTPIEKEKLFLLTDYELLKQELNGLHVVEQGQIKRSVLVTSHYANTAVQEQAAKTGTKILPKQLASEVPILIDHDLKYSESTNTELKHVDLVIVDDDRAYAQNMIDLVFSGLAVDHYTNPEHFLAEAAQYPKDTKICLDQNFKGCRMDGLYLAEQLNQLGYTKLYLISGEEFDKRRMPKYLKILDKTNIGEVLNL